MVPGQLSSRVCSELWWTGWRVPQVQCSFGKARPDLTAVRAAAAREGCGVPVWQGVKTAGVSRVHGLSLTVCGERVVNCRGLPKFHRRLGSGRSGLMAAAAAV
jgi:hypothetical protein